MVPATQKVAVSPEERHPVMARPIFLLTDFGLSDPFVGIMKAVLLRLSPGSALVDLTHGIPPQDVVAGAVALEDALPWLPADAVVCAVVDPGVGGSRRAVAFSAAGRAFVGPDNGLLAPAWSAGARAVELQPGGEIQPARSATFHGRDVFAPAAGLLAAGSPLEVLGRPIAGILPLDVPAPAPRPDGSVVLAVVSVDHFGNVTLNLCREGLAALAFDEARVVLEAGERAVTPLVRTFSDVPTGHAAVYWNSAGRLEVAINGGDASRSLGLSRGDRVILRQAPP
jgi:S-adenosylmethionine hydrolase